jgi:hypothetical protein
VPGSCVGSDESPQPTVDIIKKVANNAATNGNLNASEVIVFPNQNQQKTRKIHIKSQSDSPEQSIVLNLLLLSCSKFCSRFIAPLEQFRQKPSIVAYPNPLT